MPLRLTPREQLGSMFFGTVISFILHGIACCQTIWFFRTQSNLSSKSLNALVIFVWLTGAFDCAFTFSSTMNTIFLPANASPCADWTEPAQILPSTICMYTVEGFFTMRVWRLSEHKRLTMLVFIPYLAGFVFGVAQTVQSLRGWCNPSVHGLGPVFFYGMYCSKILGDGAVTVTMCYILYRRSSGFMQRTNTIKIVRGLVLFSISTGLLTSMNSILILLSNLNVVSLGLSLYFISGGLYANAMFAQLNARTRYRAIAEAPISLSSIAVTSPRSRIAAT